MLRRKQLPKKDIVLIHGAWSTTATFNYLTTRLSGHPALGEFHALSYDIQKKSLADVCSMMRHYIECNLERPAVIVGHSLGGIIALAQHDCDNVDSIVTAASPIHGMHINRIFQGLLAWRCPFIMCALQESQFIKDLHRQEYTKPIDVMVTTAGYNPALFEPNDGVVSVRSQHSWLPNTSKVHYLPFNHHEVLQSEHLYKTVENRLTYAHTP